MPFIKETNKHFCGRPGRYMFDVGSVWQCDRCGKVSILKRDCFGGKAWKEMSSRSYAKFLRREQNLKGVI